MNYKRKVKSITLILKPNFWLSLIACKKIKLQRLIILFPLTFLTLFSAIFSASAQEKIIIGAIHAPPYFTVLPNSDAVTGLVPELLVSIFSPLNIEVEYKVLSLKRVKVALINGDIDAFPLMVDGIKAIDKVALSDKYWSANNYVWALRSKYHNGIEWESYADLTEYKIGIVRTANYGPETDRFIRNNSGIFYQSDTSPGNIKLLLGGRFDATFSNEDIIVNYNKDQTLVRSSKALYTYDYRIGFSLKSPFVSRIKSINEQIKQIEKVNERTKE